MARYQLIWRLFAGAVAAAGVVLEVVTHPLSTLIAISAVCAAVSVCVGLGTRVSEGQPAISPSAIFTQVCRGALVGIVGLTALVGLATLGAPTMLLAAGVVVATSPPIVVKVLGPDVLAAGGPSRLTIDVQGEQLTGPVDDNRAAWVSVAELASADVQAMDTRALVRDWRRSFVALELAGDPGTKMALVKVRQAFLDELERRDPSGLREWLDSGARAAGDPTKFMTSDGDPGTGDPHAA